MKHIPVLAIVSFVVIIFGGVFLVNSKTQKEADVLSISDSLPNQEIDEYFWRTGCSHCAKVDEFIQGWEHKDNINIEKINVDNNKDNQIRLLTRAISCGIPQDKAGVPLLYTTDGECKLGEIEVIEHLQNTFTPQDSPEAGAS